MFNTIDQTSHHPQKPTMIWDEECGFCKYWILYWKSKTSDRVEYDSIYEVADQYPEIPLKEFLKASRFIETDGRVYSGPASAYKSMTYFDNPITGPLKWYRKYPFFKSVSDHLYNFIAKHRPFFWRVTVLLWGKNPLSRKKYWLIYLVIIAILLYFLF